MILSLKRRAPMTKFAVGFTAAIVFGIALWRLAPPPKYTASPTNIELDGERFTLETAVTEAQRRKGLGGREGLCETCAMLFVFEKPGQYAFWMKDMRFPIDIIWLLQNRVVFVARKINPYFSDILDPGVAADRVIELPSGAAKNVDVGEEMLFSY